MSLAISTARPPGRCGRPSTAARTCFSTSTGRARSKQIQNSALGQHTLSIFLLPPSIAELRRRLEGRGQDDAETIARRMQKSWDEISHWDGYDFVLVNDDLDATEARLKTIVTATRLRRIQQPDLTDHVRHLQSEFEELS